MVFFVEDEMPELPDPPLPPTSPGAPDVAAAASTTLLVVWTLLKVLLPLTETTVVRNCAVTLPVLEEDTIEGVERVLKPAFTEDVDFVARVDCNWTLVMDAWIVWLETAVVAVKLFAEVEGLESVVCVLVGDESDVAIGVTEAVTVAAAEADVGVVKVGFAPPAVIVGTLF